MAQLQSTGVTGSLVVTGTITAQEFHTEYVSSSILHESGSTSFGNSSDDVHNMTGSLNLLGAGTFTGNMTANAFYGDGSGLTSVSGTDNTKLPLAGGTMTGDLQIPEYLYHAGDTNTYLRFLTDQLQLAAGGRNVISMDEGTDPDIVVLGDSTTTTWTDGKLGVGTSTPQRDVEFIGPGNDYLSLGVAQISVGQFTGIHFGYRENNNLYRKSAIVFERTDLTSNDAQGKIHILNGPQGSSGNATLSDAHLTVAENGNIGIGTTSPTSKLEVYGSGSTVLDIQGSQGQLFSITDDLTGDLLVASDISGIPIFTVNAADGVTVDGDTVISGSLTVTGSDNSQLTVLGNASFGLPGNGSNTLGRYISIEGNADASGEGSGRIFFTEHNSTTTSMSNYGMSIGYRGGGTSIVGTDGNTWTGLSAIGNGQWGMWGHDNDATGTLIMYGDRGGTFVDFASNNIQGITDIYVADQILHTGDTNTYMQFHAADQWRVVTGGTERLEVNNTQVTVANNLSVGGTASGNGSGLTSLNASNISSGTINGARLPWQSSDTFTGTYNLVWRATDDLYTASWLQVNGTTDELLTRGIKADGIVSVTPGTSGTTAANRAFQVTTSDKGAVHVLGGESGTSGAAYTVPLITFPGNASSVQGGLYLSQNSSTGTSLGIFTTDSYSTGPQLAMSIFDNGVVNILRNTLNTQNITVGDGSADTRIAIKKADNNVSDHIQFYNGTTRVGEIGCEDNTWLRINQETAKNIYTPRYIRADAGLFVDDTSHGINASGNLLNASLTGTYSNAVTLSNSSNALTSATLQTTGTGALDTPVANARLNAEGIQFGGANNAKQINSAQISAGWHQASSLNIVGMSSDTSSTNRRVDIWAEAGLYLQGSSLYPATDNTGEIGNASYTWNSGYFTNLNVDGYIYHGGDTNTYIRFVGGDDLQLVAGGRQMIRMDEGTDPDKLRFVTDDNWTDSNGDWNMSGRVAAGDQVSVNNRTAISVAHWAASVNTTGAIKIQIPGTHGGNWSMLVLRITAYEYNSTAATIYYVSGHDWTSGWYNNGVTKIGNGDKDVSLGYDSNYDYVIVGGTSSSWAYGHVTVDVMAHPSFFSGNMDITSGWTISQVTSLSGITTQSVTNKRVLTTSDEGSGNGIDADTVDGIQASSFIRSDADDNVAGHTEWQDNKNVRLGNGADFRMWHDGTDTYFRNYNHAGGNMYWTGENTAGTNQALIYMITNTAATYVRMFANGAERFRTIDGGSRVYGRIELDDSNTKLLKGTNNALNITTNSGNVTIGPQNTSWCHMETDRSGFYWNKKLIVNGGTIGSYDEDLSLVRANSNNDRILIRSTNIGFILDGAEDMRLENDGDLHVESDVIAYSSTISDSRLKDNVITIGGALDKVKKLRGVEYTWNKGGRKDQRDLGVIAQEVEEVIPEIVREKKMPLMDDSETKYKTVDYEKLTAVLIEGMKEQQAQIEELKARIDELERK